MTGVTQRLSKLFRRGDPDRGARQEQRAAAKAEKRGGSASDPRGDHRASGGKDPFGGG